MILITALVTGLINLAFSSNLLLGASDVSRDEERAIGVGDGDGADLEAANKVAHKEMLAEWRISTNKK